MTQVALQISADERTEDLLQVLLAEVDDHTLDQMDVNRQVAKPQGLAAEPMTVSVALLVSPALLIQLLVVIDRYLQKRIDIEHAILVIEAHEKDPNLSKLVADIRNKKPPGWSLSFGKLQIDVDVSD